MKTMKILFVLITTIPSIGMTSAAAAQVAQDDGYTIVTEKTYSGAACQPKLGTQTDYFKYFGQKLANSSSTAHEISCDIVRDSNADKVTTEVRVHDNNQWSWGVVSCKLWSCNKFGQECISDSASTSSQFIGDTSLKMQLYIPGTTREGFYYVGCKLGPYSSIYSIYVEERQKAVE